MKILQVNVRLSEGGAAQVARNLEIELEKLGHSTTFLYGYGPRGGTSGIHNPAKHIKFTSKLSAITNLLFYRILGHENNFLTFRKERKLVSIFQEVDVVHLHAIHSYFVDYKILVNALLKSKVPFVWTFHDQWIMTGRCAQPGNCTNWMNGCIACPNKRAYPEALIDRASHNFKSKKIVFEKLFNQSNYKAVSCAKWLQKDLEIAGFKHVQVIRNSVDSDFIEAIKNIQPSKIKDNLFVCRDLRDGQKIDWQLLARISEIPDQSLTIVGDNSPTQIPQAVFLSSTYDREQLAIIYKSHRRLIFTSRTDYYPLTIAEALICGLDIFAIRSPAAMEFMGHPNLFVFDSADELYSSLANRKIDNSTNTIPSEKLIDKFLPSRMAQDYEELYRELLNKNQNV